MLAEKTNIPMPTQGNEKNHRVSDSQKHILGQVALRLFHHKGYARTSFSAIAKAAGLSVKDAQQYFSSPREICLHVIEIHRTNQKLHFDEICQQENPRQRLSLYLDSIVENSDEIIAYGCPLTNLYYDVKREDTEIADLTAGLLQQRLDWIREQFILIKKVETPGDLPERLASAIQGVSIMAQVTADERLIRSQVNQLKSWIRSM